MGLGEGQYSVLKGGGAVQGTWVGGEGKCLSDYVSNCATLYTVSEAIPATAYITTPHIAQQVFELIREVNPTGFTIVLSNYKYCA